MEKKVTETLLKRTEATIRMGNKIMDLCNVDMSDFYDIGISRFSKLTDLLYEIWRVGLDLTCLQSEIPL